MCNKVHLLFNNSKTPTILAKIRVFENYQVALNLAESLNKRRSFFAKMLGHKWFVKTFDVIHGEARK